MRLFSAAALCVLVATTPARTAETTAGLDLVSAYVFRGVTYNDGPCLQPYVETSAGPLAFNVWANFDLNDYDLVQAGDFSEIDLTLSCGFFLGETELTAGVMEFLFPEGGPDTNTGELFMSADVPLVGGIGASAYVGYDFVLVKDVYASVGLAYELPLDALAVTASVKAGYAGEDASAGGAAGFHEYEVKLQGEYPVSESLTLGGFLMHTSGIDADVLPEQDVDFFGGLTLGLSF
ncbi:MltA-interacting MipA family protein [Candidatus Fermentibacteria bacterium]|nr:MltA-interacting MipA family protein [Candidatus Fermentibacteria bacterium]